ncbi:MAG: flavin reductase family protein [Micrococcales bacterium]|nr:flavin reductase family protein [Micrococcales bacterium]
MPRRFVALPLDKHAWSPAPLLGQVVLITTVDQSGAVDVAPKSWVSMVSFTGPILGFGCRLRHRTYRNVAATGEFVVNVPGSSSADDVWSIPEAGDRLTGLTLVPARTVAPPVIEECPAHLECRHERTVELPGGEVFVLGTVTAVAVDEAAVATEDIARRYAALDLFVFLEDGWHAALGRATRVVPHPVPPA